MIRRPKDTEAQQFSRRLRQAMKDAGYKLSPTVLANEFNLRYWGEGITAHAARNWLNGTSLPKPDKLRILADWLRVSPQELLFGPSLESSVYASRESSPGYTVSLADDSMLRKYRSLTQDHRRMIREIVAGLFCLDQQKPTKPPGTDREGPPTDTAP